MGVLEAFLARLCLVLHASSAPLPGDSHIKMTGMFVRNFRKTHWFSPAHKHKHNASENSSNISVNISTKHKKDKHLFFLCCSHQESLRHKHKKNGHVFLVLMLVSQ